MPYDTKLSPSDESKFQTWKSIYAPKDSGQDYDLRGAFKAGLSPNPETGHWPDTFKKPNHPTFSNQSIYAKDAPDKAGTWQGDTYIPPTKPMAQDDILNAAQNRRRTGRSFFPAANGSAQGQTIGFSGAGNGGFRALPPDQNPAYQAAISRPRPNMNNYTWITTPSGGQMRVPTGSVGNLLAPGTSLTGSQVTQIGNQAPIDRNAAYAKGYGAPTPNVQQFAGGPALVQGGVANPVANISPQQRVQYGVGTGLDYLRTNPALNVAVSALGGFGRNIASWFGGGNLPNAVPSANAAVPSPTPLQTPSPSPTPTATPFRVADGRSDLLKDAENTFYGGGNAPVPSPTPTPYQPSRLAYNAPRRYSDLGYY